MGVRYGQLLQSTDLENLPPAARATVHTSCRLFQTTDRGLVRQGNDRTVDYRASCFRDWLGQACGYEFIAQLASLRPPQVVLLLGAFLDHVASTPYNSKGDTPMANTLSHHLHVTAAFLQPFVHQPFSIYDTTAASKGLHPILRARLDHTRKWQKPRDKREPFTYPMFTTLFHQVQALCQADARNNLGLLALVFDAVRLGIFTGCRSCEYAQSKGPVGTISRVPQPASDLSPPKAVAFIADDFKFFGAGRVKLSHAQVLRHPHQAVELHIRFQHDKSGRNYSFENLVLALPGYAQSLPLSVILRRASLLAIPANNPICAYQSPSGGTLYLRSQDVTDVMRKICTATYSNPQHYMWVNIHRIASHSNRITAAVALYLQKVPIDAIAFRLRWQPDSVQTICESAPMILAT